MFLTLLAILFIALKLCGVIAWSWWWVLSPLWVGVVFLLFAVGGFFGCAHIVRWFDRRKR